MNQSSQVLLNLTVLLCLVSEPSAASTADPRGIQFIPFKSPSAFNKSPGDFPSETVLTSPEIHARIRWDELIVSWNAEMSPDSYLKVEARAFYPERPSRWYVMGLWSGDPAKHPRESVRRQNDEDGRVDTDTLILKQPAERFQLRLTLGGDSTRKPKIKFLGVSLLADHTVQETLPPNRAA